MPISSMTGFARTQGELEDRSWIWEVRGINARGLDVRCRLPFGFESLEAPARDRIAKRFKRGNLSLTLTATRTAGQGRVRVNTEVLDQLLALVPQLHQRLQDFRPPSADGLLGLRGVIEPIDDVLSDEARAAIDQAFLDGLDSALAALERMRREEGGRLGAVLAQHLDRLAELCGRAGSVAAAQPETVFQRLKDQMEELLKAAPGLPEDRLVQEAALLATRADPREEIDRLKAHCSAALDLLAADGPVGRRLDFLCQELNREANTLCAKSADVELTRIGLDLKAAIEQLREQVQNVE